MSIGRVPGASGISPTIVDAKGDLIAGTAADSVDRLAVGTNNHVLMAASGEATGLKYAAEATATLTTTGDLLYASAANTLARRAIGSTGDVLTVSGGLPTWAAPASGGMTLISTTTLSTGTVNISSIPATYNNIRVVIRGFVPSVDGERFNVRVNADNTANRYGGPVPVSNTSESNISFNQSQWDNVLQNDNAVGNGLIIIDFPDYANTSTWKIVEFTQILVNNVTTTNYNWRKAIGFYNQTGAINAVNLVLASGTFSAGSALLYGIK